MDSGQPHSPSGRRAPTTLSIVIPLHNSVPFAQDYAQSMASLDLSSRGQAVEVILIDDGSQDASLESFIEATPDPVRILHDRLDISQGPAPSRNRGMKLATGEFVTFWDADDRAAVGPYLALVDLMAATGGDVGIVGCALEGPGPATIALHRPTEGHDLTDFIAPRAAVWRFVFRLGSLRAAAIQFPNFRFGEDLLFLLDAQERLGSSVVVSSDIAYHHRLGRPGSLSTHPDKDEACLLLEELYVRGLAARDARTCALIAQWWMRVWRRQRLRIQLRTLPILVRLGAHTSIQGGGRLAADWMIGAARRSDTTQRWGSEVDTRGIGTQPGESSHVE
jgi:glycosyltransferase involved in cell wall biosynthesis